MGCVKAKRQQTIKRRQKSIKSNYEITADVGATKIVVVIYKAQLTTTMTSKSAKMFVVSGQQQKVSKRAKGDEGVREMGRLWHVLYINTHTQTPVHPYVCVCGYISRTEDACKKGLQMPDRKEEQKRGRGEEGSLHRVRFTT